MLNDGCAASLETTDSLETAPKTPCRVLVVDDDEDSATLSRPRSRCSTSTCPA